MVVVEWLAIGSGVVRESSINQSSPSFIYVNGAGILEGRRLVDWTGGLAFFVPLFFLKKKSLIFDF